MELTNRAIFIIQNTKEKLQFYFTDTDGKFGGELKIQDELLLKIDDIFPSTEKVEEAMYYFVDRIAKETIILKRV